MDKIDHLDILMVVGGVMLIIDFHHHRFVKIGKDIYDPINDFFQLFGLSFQVREDRDRKTHLIHSQEIAMSVSDLSSYRFDELFALDIFLGKLLVVVV